MQQVNSWESLDGSRVGEGVGTRASMSSGRVERKGDTSDLVSYVSRRYALSPRETEVLTLASMGTAGKEISVRLGLSAKTVEYFWNRIYGKLGCHSQIEAMALLLRCAIRSEERESLRP